MKEMIAYPGAGYTVTVYQDSDLPKLQNAIDCAKTLWRDRCQTYMNKNGDTGSCVMGAGIKIDYLAPRCRNRRNLMIISASEVCNAQGSLVWEDSVKEVVEYLKSKGIEAYYASGIMD